jgi:hypothetical protein
MLVRHRGRWLLAILATDTVVAVGAAPLGQFVFGPAIASGAVAGVAVLTFLGLYGLAMRRDASPSADDIRSVIAVTVLITYLVLVGLVSFFQGDGAVLLNPLTSTLVNNFTVVTGIVIAFYFGTSAVVAVADRARPSSGEAKERARSNQAPESSLPSQADG